MRAWLKALLARLFGRGAPKPVPSGPPVLAEEAVRPGPPPPSGMQQLLVMNGVFPQEGPAPAQFTVGMIESFAGSYPAYGARPCTGGTLPIMGNQPLTAVMGTSFGGNGITTIGVPDLHARVAIGGAPAGGMRPGALVLNWLIAMDASVDAPLPGTVTPFCGTVVPGGWAPCAGATLSVQQYAALFAAIGTAFGGNGVTTFQLPDLNGAAPMGLGPGTALGQKVSGTIDGLGLNYIINTGDLLAPGSGDGEPPADYAYAGQVTAYAGALIPQGWAACDGSVLPISHYPTLFQAIGDIWGGDGKTSFGLPDLRGRMMPGA